MPSTSYLESWILKSASAIPCLATITRKSNLSITSKMLGGIQTPPQPEATLDQTITLALAFLAIDGEVTLSLPDLERI